MYVSFLSLELTLTPPKPDAHTAGFDDPPAAAALGRHLLNPFFIITLNLDLLLLYFSQELSPSWLTNGGLGPLTQLHGRQASNDPIQITNLCAALVQPHPTLSPKTQSSDPSQMTTLDTALTNPPPPPPFPRPPNSKP